MALILVTLATPIASAGDAENVTALLRGCEGSSAEFVQKFLPKGFKKEKIERGNVVFGTLPAMRWAYADPEKKEFVFDGTTSWLWVPADRQVTVHELTEEERAALPFFALSDPSRIAKQFTLSRSGRTTTLKARDRKAMLLEISVEAASDGRLSRLRYLDSQGNATTFEFSRFAAAPAGREAFTFVPPPGVDVVRN
ncbi:MAG: outer-membrane lipoprotein carrier protein LolA [Thermoanaerobaculia bacterium]|nr:outer-membrane lipoprotein carrier protein LolA [Thermoanaerobaculia bacterium]